MRRRAVGDGGRHEIREEGVRGRVHLVQQEYREYHGDDERQDHADQCFDGVDQVASVVGRCGVEDLVDQCRGHYVMSLWVVATKTVCTRCGQ